MHLLFRQRDVSHTAARDALHLTDGNLASHAARLADAGLLTVRRALTPNGFERRYQITAQGAAAFLEFVSYLSELVKDK